MIDNYADLTLGTYLDIDEVLNTEAEEIDKQVAIVSILSGIREEELLQMPLPDYAVMAVKTDFLKKPCPLAPLPDELVFDGVRYIPTKDFINLTTAQFVDFQTFAKKGTAAMPELLSVLLIPEGHRYNDGYDLARLRESIKGQPLAVALSLSAFFFDSFRTSCEVTITSSIKAAKKTKDKKMRAQITEALKTIRQLFPTAGDGLQM